MEFNLGLIVAVVLVLAAGYLIGEFKKNEYL
jgi:hypothetical protein